MYLKIMIFDNFFDTSDDKVVDKNALHVLLVKS